MLDNLYVIYDLLGSGYKTEALELLSLIASLFAVAVISIKNPISSLMCLIGLFGSVAVYLIIIGFNFIGFSYLIVYIGAVSILFLFILMLINIRASELTSNNSNSVPLALLIIILLNYTWIETSPEYTSVYASTDNNAVNFVYTNLFSELGSWLQSLIGSSDIQNNVMYISSVNWDGAVAETSHIVNVGLVMYSTFNIWLLLASLILLLAMIGSIVITLKQKTN